MTDLAKRPRVISRPLGAVNARQLDPIEPLLPYLEVPMADRMKTQVGVNREYGACRCWICRKAFPGPQEREWLVRCLARDLLRKGKVEREVWLAGYALRHGSIITQQLRTAIQTEQGRRAYAR